ncbi:helix-turn-helix transcriptional regulator [Candidatus Gracilibacteria bacterium]|nr:helix-turn-helix transcriptional regulator [Candidatus Gracilibacteria bacterium]
MKNITDLEIQAEKISEILKTIAHPKRLLILCRLSSGPQTVTALVKSCHISQSQLSQFLTKMREEGILTCEKSGLYVTYRISNPEILQLLTSLSSIYCP